MLRRAAAAALALAVALASPARAETLADALAAAYESSGLIEQNRALLRAADEDVAQAVAALRPVVSWIAQARATYPDPAAAFGGSDWMVGSFAIDVSAGLQASVTLWDAGQRLLGVEAQKEVVLATRQSLVGVEQQVLARVVAAYLNVQRAGAFVQLRDSNVRLITRELRAAQDRFDVGETTRTEVALAEARLAAARSQLAAQQGQLAQAQAEYVAAVGGRPDGALRAAPAARVPATVAEARAIGLRASPAVIGAQHQVAAAEIVVRQVEAGLRPRVELSGQVLSDQNADLSAVATLQATGPVYAGGRGASQVRQAQARRDAARAGLLSATRQVEADVATAYASLEVARASRGAFEQQVRAAQVAFDGVREEADLGARTTLDVLDAEQDLLDARSNLVSAQIDETLAGYQVLAAMGLLTAQNLGLAVQVYDPTAYYDLVDDAPGATSQQGRALDRVLEAIGGGG